jgi:hypothetical protein
MRTTPVAALVLTLLVLAFLAQAASGDTLRVPEEYAGVQAAIAAAADGDVVAVAPGIYVGDVDFLGKAIEVRGAGVVVTGGLGAVDSAPRSRRVRSGAAVARPPLGPIHTVGLGSSSGPFPVRRSPRAWRSR